MSVVLYECNERISEKEETPGNFNIVTIPLHIILMSDTLFFIKIMDLRKNY